MFWYPLLRPFSYLTIQGARKSSFDWWVPISLSAITTAALFMLPSRPPIFLADGILSQLGSMIQNLPGFYIAALAAIATFPREGLDTLLPPPTPKLNTFINGRWVPVELTRRRMLTLLFGYLAALSFFLYLMIVAANVIAPAVRIGVGESGGALGAIAATGILMFLVWHMLCVTLFGLYQLSDRIFQPDPS